MAAAVVSGSLFCSTGNVRAQSGTWTHGASIPDASYSLGGAFVGGKFYAISGFATPRLGIYDPTNNTWTTGSPLPADTGYNLRESFGTAVLNGKIYVVGGDTGGSGARATLLRYDPALNSWTTLAPMPLGARLGLGAAVLNGEIYAVGGNDLTNYLTRVEEYNPTNNSWTTKASMPKARGFALVGAINGKLYVAGGTDGSSQLTSTHVYDPSLNKWSTNAPMPFTNGSGDGVVLNGKLFSIGGGPSPQQRVFAYDPALNSWSTNFALMPTGRAGIGVAADEVNNRIFAVAGWNGSYVSALEIFTPVPPLNIALAGNLVVVFYELSGTNYTLQSTTNLASGIWVTASNGVPFIAIGFTNSSPARFFRLH